MKPILLLLGLFTVVIIILLLIHYLKTPTAQEHYTRSSGIYDTHAAAALAAIDARNPADRFTRAQVRLHNIMRDDRFDDRYRGGLLDAVADDYFHVMNDLNTLPVTDADYMLMQIHAFNDIYTPTGIIPQPFVQALTTANVATTERTIAERKQIAAAEPTPVAAVDKYFDLSAHYKSEPQNVHDIAVNSDLRQTLARIRMHERDPVSARDAISEAREYAEGPYAENPLNDGAKVRRAIGVLNRIAENNFISTFADTEANIFASVWGRANHPSNRKSADVMREAIIDAVADADQDGNIVCINGRTARVLNALATIDSDSQIADAAMTMQAYKNQAFAEAREIITREIATAAQSQDPARSAVGQMFNEPSRDNVEVDEQTEREFISDVKQEISRNMEQYRNKFSPGEYQKILAECYAGIEF